MLPQKNRIKEGADFEVICRHGKAFSGKGLVLRVRENKSGFFRLGVSVGLKFSPKAVTRNRIKRQIRAFFGQNLLKIKSDFDVLVIIGKGWNEKTNPSEELKQILAKNGLFKE